MKFMINGALTLGTLDGANVEMSENVGLENIYIFGLTAKEVDELWHRGYDASRYYNDNVRLRRIIEALKKGFNGESFANIADYLLTGSPVADPYMCMADFGAYKEARGKILTDYADKTKWAKMSLNNIASAGVFSADRSIREYADKIWDLKTVK